MAKPSEHKIDLKTLIEHAAADENASAAWKKYRRIKDAGGVPEIYYTPPDYYRVESLVPIRGNPK
jgi:hypothetical protein